MADDLKASMEEILRTAIEREADSFEYYESAARLAFDPRLKRFLLGLAEMERGHRQRLIEELDALENQRWIDDAISC